MSVSPTTVLDASALLAYLQGEPGSPVVTNALLQGSAMSSINWAETLSKLAERGQDPDIVTQQLTDRGLLNSALIIYPVDELQARAIAKLRRPTQPQGLSLGDRACLALTLHLNLPALTCDRVWASLTTGVTITVIR